MPVYNMNSQKSGAIWRQLIMVQTVMLLAVFSAETLPAYAQDSATLLARKGNAQLIRKENDKAILTLSEALSVGTLPLYTKASIFNDRALAYARIKKHERALKDFNSAIETFPEYATAYNNRGLLLLSLGYHEEAIEDFNRAIALQPKLGATFHNRANAFLKAGAEAAAFKDYGQAIKLLNNRAPSHLARGQIHWAHDRHYATLRELNRALEENDNFAEIFYNRGEVYRSLGKQNEAIADIQRSAELAPDNMAYKMTLAKLLIDIGKVNRAIKLFTVILKAEPLNAQAMILRGRLYGLHRSYKRALDDLDQAVSLTNGARAYAERALVRSKHKMPDLAIEDMDLAVQRSPKTAHNWAILGEAARQVQLVGNAERYYLESLKRDKDNKVAINGLIELGLRESEDAKNKEELLGSEEIQEEDLLAEDVVADEPTWAILEYETGKYIATHASYDKLKVHLDLYGPNPPQILEWTELNGKYKNFGLLRYEAGSKNQKQPIEQVSIIDLRKQKVLSIEPYRWGKKIAKWEWGDYDLVVRDREGIENKIALRAPPVRRRAPAGANKDDWLFGNDGFWLSSQNKSKKKRKVRVRKKKKKSLFGIFGF